MARPASIPLPKRCIFCQTKTRLTREDFFPKWFRELYPAPPEAQKARLPAEVTWHEIDPKSGQLIERVAPSKMARPGDLADQTLRVVCAACNNGWMSRLQEDAKPVLVPYILGKWPRPNRAARKIISSWATMFAMVVEFGDEQSAVVPPIERAVFRRDQQPTLGAYVWAGRLAGDMPYWFHRRGLRAAQSFFDPPGRPNAQITTIALGHLLLQVYLTTSDLKPFDPEQRALEQGLSPLWPLKLKGQGHHRATVRDEAAARDLAYRHLTEDYIPGVTTPYRRNSSGFLGGATE